MTNAQHLSKTVPISYIYCKNKLVVVGCSNHRVVTLVADKLERQWL